MQVRYFETWLMDEKKLSQPALLSDDDIEVHNNDKTQTWAAMAAFD